MTSSHRITVSSRVWEETWAGLRARGHERREAACIWAGTRDGTTEVVRHVYFIDDHPEVRSGPYSHVIAPQAVERVLAEVRRRGLVIVCDLHTHPSSWVGLSDIDRANPIEFRVGIIAMVLPDFGCGEPCLSRVGLHRYLGMRQWRQLTASEILQTVEIAETGQ